MDETRRRILTAVTEYYDDSLREFGATPRGVDWNSAEGQRLRFAQFDRLLDGEERFSISDIGCGYGAYCEYLCERSADFRYVGYDLSERMIGAARARIGKAEARFAVGARPDEVTDFAVASGIFNVRGGEPDETWFGYMLDTIDSLATHSRRGFAFNCLTAYSDAEKMRPDLYYADPVRLFTHCRETYSRNVALLHDYGLYEFTIVVKAT